MPVIGFLAAGSPSDVNLASAFRQSFTNDGNLGAATTHVQSTGVPGRNLVTHAATQPTAPRIAMP
jgi:hypothetical protein